MPGKDQAGEGGPRLKVGWSNCSFNKGKRTRGGKLQEKPLWGLKAWPHGQENPPWKGGDETRKRKERKQPRNSLPRER